MVHDDRSLAQDKRQIVLRIVIEPGWQVPGKRESRACRPAWL